MSGITLLVLFVLFLMGLSFIAGVRVESSKSMVREIRQRHVRARIRELSVDDLGHALLEQTLKTWTPPEDTLVFLEHLVDIAYHRAGGDV